MNTLWTNVVLRLGALLVGNVALAGFLMNWGIRFPYDGNFLGYLIIAFVITGKLALIAVITVCGFIALAPPRAFDDEEEDSNTTK